MSAARPDAVQSLLDDLLNDAINAALGLLRRGATFAPFGLTIDEVDSRSMLSVGAHAAALQGLDALLQELEGMRETIVAYALVRDLPVGADRRCAVEVHLQHRSGVATLVHAPYRRTPGDVDVFNLRAREARVTLW